MAETRQRIHCENHGGYFYREPKRGRVPTKCGGKNDVCDLVATGTTEPEPEAPAPQRKRASLNGANPSLDKGKAAKELLEAQGWTATGKAWTDEEGGKWASVTGARGEEMLHIVWLNGEVQDQVYNLWNLDKPSANGRPNAHLPFDPEEIPDAELARYLVGVRVTWWNKLAGREEKGICGKDSITVEHMWNGTGDEYLGARIIKFIDGAGGGYRAFRLDQLMKVG